MRARVREINIFSLSMMDVISGAMGAFLIIMIGLARYYQSDPTSTQTVKRMEQQLEEAEKVIELLKGAVRNEGIDPEKLLQLVRQLEQQLGNARHELVGYRARLDQAQSQISRLRNEQSQRAQQEKKLENEKAKLQRDLAARKPILIQLERTCTGIDIDVYLYKPRGKASNFLQPPFDPELELPIPWPGDLYSDANTGPNADVYVKVDLPAGLPRPLYYQMLAKPAKRQPCTVKGKIQFINNKPAVDSISLPSLALGPDQPWELAGYVSVDNKRNIRFKAATDRERQEERKRVPLRLAQFKDFQSKRENSQKNAE